MDSCHPYNVKQKHEISFETGLRDPNGDALRLHNVLWITKHESRVILFWNNNLTKEETEKYTVKYILSYKFFNSTHERKERLQEKKKIIHLELYSGFNAKVKTQLFAKETEDVIKESGWTEFIYKAPPVYIQNLSCIIYNTSFFNCTWHITEEAPEDIQIFVSHRFRCLEVITMPVPHPSDNIKTWLAADEAHHQKPMSVEMEMHSEVGLDVREENGDENMQRPKRLKEYGLQDLWG
ncbi:hypothetical protein Q9966_015510 [Columba livia]|nr:hypothetical protein Q9966_015510 [Columba livia]